MIRANLKFALTLATFCRLCQNMPDPSQNTASSGQPPATIEMLALPDKARQKQLNLGQYLELQLANVDDMQYTAKLSVGSRDEERTFLFDTGSNVLWLTSDYCQPDTCSHAEHAQPYRVESSVHGRYVQEVNISADNTQKLTYYMNDRGAATETEIRYGKGTVRGVKASDRVCFVGGLGPRQDYQGLDGELQEDSVTESKLKAGDSTAKTSVELCISEQQVLSVDQVRDLEALQADGIVGLSPLGADQILSALKTQRRIDRKIFSFSLDQGVFTLGGADTQRFAQSPDLQLDWFPIATQSNQNNQAPNTSENAWSLNMPSFKVGDQQVETQVPQAMLDTGSSLLRVPQNDLELLKTQIEAQVNTSCNVNEQSGNLECSCGPLTTVSSFPDISLNFTPHPKPSSLTSNGQPLEDPPVIPLTLTPEDYIASRVGLTCYTKLNQLGQPDSTPPLYWVLGAPFLRRYYTVFDLDTQSIGLVKSTQQPSLDQIDWPQFQANIWFFTLRFCMVASIGYLVYEILVVRLCQHRFGVCLWLRMPGARRGEASGHGSRRRRRVQTHGDLAKKELVDFEADVDGQMMGGTELDFSCSSDQQSSSYDESGSYMEDSEQSGRHSDSSSISQSYHQQAQTADRQQSFGEQANARSSEIIHQRRKYLAQRL